MGPAPEVAVVGGGVIGCASAWYLARAGVRVELFERGAIGAGATQAAAGMLAPLAESATPGPFADLAILGLRAFAEDAARLAEESGVDVEYRRCGILRVAFDDGEAEALRRASGWQASSGLDVRWLGSRQVASLEPSLAPVVGGLLSSEEGSVRPVRLATALAAAAARAGAILHEHGDPPSPWVEDGRMRGLYVRGERREYRRVVLAAGVWSGTWASAVRVRVPVRPVKGQSLLLRAVPPPIRHVVFAGHAYLVPRADATIYAGATQEDAGYDVRLTGGAVATLLAQAIEVVPSLAAAEFTGGVAGLRPGSPDGRPVLGPAPGMDGLILAAGHFRNGILLSLITGRIVRDLVTGHEPPIPLDPFSAARFE